MTSTSQLSIALQRLRAEGLASFLARALDHRADRRRERSFRKAPGGAGPLRSQLEAPDGAGPLRSQLEAPDGAGPLRGHRVDALSGVAPPPVLNLLGFPPRRSRGGVALQWLDRHAVEVEYRTVARLFPLAGRVRLEIETRDLRHQLDLGPAWAQDDGDTFTRIVESALRFSGASRLHVETLHDLPLRAVATVAARCPTVLSIHDFSAFCFRPHLIDAAVHEFCEFSTDLGRCSRCLATAGGRARGLDLIELRSFASECLQHARHLVFASEFARRQLLQRFPAALQVASTVVAPALALPPVPPRAPASGAAPHVAFAGAVSVEKGSRHLLELARVTREQGGRFTVFGAADADSTPELGARGWFRARHLSRLLLRHAVDLIVVPSEAPETHALVIDESWWAGVPVLTSDRGALPDRVRAGGGMAVPHAELATTLASLLGDPARLATLRDSIDRASVSDPRAAAAAVLEIYGAV